MSNFLFVECKSTMEVENLFSILESQNYFYGTNFKGKIQQRALSNCPYVAIDRTNGCYTGSKGRACGEGWVAFEDLKLSSILPFKARPDKSELDYLFNQIHLGIQDRKRWIENREAQIRDLGVFKKCLNEATTDEEVQRLSEKIFRILK